MEGEVVNPYPLQWPDSMPRKKNREKSAFKTELAQALKNVEKSLLAFGADSRHAVTEVVLTSNVTLGQNSPADPGVAVWFKWDGSLRCIAVDRYQTVKENLQAIHHVLEARRVELRHGTIALVRATFAGFKALPPPENARPWRTVLGIGPFATYTAADVDTAFRSKSKDAHPDSGGSREAWAELERAKKLALRDLSS